MAIPDLSFIDPSRAIEVEAVDAGRATSEFTLSPAPGNFQPEVGEDEEESIHGRPVDDVQEVAERRKELPQYIELARLAFQQRGLEYPFYLDASQQSLAINPALALLAEATAGLSRIIRLGNPEASRFEKRAFRALHRALGGWGVCIGSPRVNEGVGAERAIRWFRERLASWESGAHWPVDFGRNGDKGADGFVILGRYWGGPIAFYQSKNTGFDLQSHPEEFSRIPSITEDWFGRKLTQGRCIIPVLALNTVLTIELKERIFAERGECKGVHIVDAVDILAAEHLEAARTEYAPEALVL
jgi:hypothetical protein